MTRKNIGARNAPKPTYNRQNAFDDVFLSDFEGNEGIRMAIRDAKQALEWIQERSTPSDNVPSEAANRLLDGLESIEGGNDPSGGQYALRAAFDVLSTQMHPTARDIVGAPAKQVIYTITGKRAHTYRIDQ